MARFSKDNIIAKTRAKTWTMAQTNSVTTENSKTRKKVPVMSDMRNTLIQGSTTS
jgi:hypothetical protein